jgi:hypothetical protein
MSNKKTRTTNDRILIKTTLSQEAYGLLEAESRREKKPIGKILDRLILEGCTIDDSYPPESHTIELEEARKRLDVPFDKVDVV